MINHFTLKQMPYWALMAEGAISGAEAEQLFSRVEQGEVLPEEWKKHSLIVLENTRRAYRDYDRTKPQSVLPNNKQHWVPITIVDAFWFDKEQGIWIADWIKAPVDGFGGVQAGIMSVCN